MLGHMGGQVAGTPPPPAEPRAAARKPLLGEDYFDPRRRLLEAGGMVALFLAVLRELVRAPYAGWWRNTVEEAWSVTIRCTIPLCLSLFALGFGTFGVQAGGVLDVLGTADRLGGVYALGMNREPGAWVTGMIVAGVAGTAMCADLGARKIREELDALRVIGVDPVRALVLPRILALTIVSPIIAIFGVLVGYASGLVATLLLYPGSGGAGPFFATLGANLYFLDIVSLVVRTAVFGLVTGVIACHKGLNASGGPEGVGRAVNQTVVLAFVAVWVFNFAFQSALLATFTDLQTVR
jgi:phospholipid/cholesterol/gamma-HCH transport system permease protein